MEMKKACIPGLLLLALMAGLAALSCCTTNAQLQGVSAADADKLGACVPRTTVLTPPRGGPGLGCDSVLKFVADGTRPDTTPEGPARFAAAVKNCCGLLVTDKARSTCTCPLQDTMDKVCKDSGDAVATLRKQCGDLKGRASELGACVPGLFDSVSGTTKLGCDTVLKVAVAGGSLGDLTAPFLSKCCRELTEDEDAKSSCTCPLSDTMEKVCGAADVQALKQKCAADPCEGLFQRLNAGDVQACRDKIKALEDSCQ